MGINVDRIIVVAFAVGATLAAVAGVAQGLQVTNINFRMGFLAGLKAFTAAVLGGIGNVWGAVVGGLTLGIVEAMAVQFIPGTFGGSPWKDVWAFALLILVLVFRPRASSARRWWTGHEQALASRTTSGPHGSKAPWLAIGGGALMILSGLLSWSYDDRILGDIVDPLLPGRHPALLHAVRRHRRDPGGAAPAPPAVAEPGPRPAHPRHHRPGVRRLGARRRSPTRAAGWSTSTRVGGSRWSVRCSSPWPATSPPRSTSTC